MLKNITFSADEKVIRKARERARKKRTPLNVAFREWLTSYATGERKPDEYDEIMAALTYARPGRRFTREDMHER